MRLTAFADFGLRALMRIASDPERAWSTAELAGEFGISRHHLAKAIAALANAGVVETRRGGGGGVVLARPAAAIRLGEVVRLLERDQALVECFQADGGLCPITPICRLKGFLGRAETAFLATLDDYSLADCTLPAVETGRV
ncbi:MAG: Rrf2 family transcriptional regulator [Rhodospirillales bacterium]